jgi:amino acid adenylation domain-containing protein
MFYSNLKELGVNYQGSFRATKSTRRTLGYASSLASWDGAGLDSLYSLHPIVLDVAFHSVLAAFASPSSGQMWSMYLPVGMQQVTIDMNSLPSRYIADVDAHISAHVTAASARGLVGDVQVMFGSRVAVQVEGAELQATGDPKTNSERKLFSTTYWDSDITSGLGDVALEKQPVPTADEALLEAMGRTALHYYRSMLEDISPREVKSLAWHLQIFWQSAQHWVEEVRSGRHPSVKREWLDDSREEVWKHVEKCQDSIDIVMMRALGDKMPSIMRSETQPLEVMMENDMLARFYIEAHALDGMNDHIARALKQITYRYPHAHILEIGAGVGGTTRKVLRAIGNSFGHYTFTDISSGFFEKGAKKFSEYTRRMTFKVCDIEKDPIDDGFGEGAYDVIVAANVLHATRNLTTTMRHVRRLLKPGGYLVMMEITGDLLRLGFLMGALPGWWLGPRDGDEGRQWAPGISAIEWDSLLQRTGFSGVSQIVSDNSIPNQHYVSTIVRQAVDDNFNILQSPLTNLALLPPLPHKLLILGGETLPIARLARDLKKALAPWKTPIDTVINPEQLALGADDQVSVISLTELDQPLFAGEITATKLRKIQSLLSASDPILWVTAGTRGSNPTANIFTGIARALRTERNDINLQILDVENPSNPKAEILAEHFIRLSLAKQPEYADHTMLWTTEPELALDGDKLVISRVIPERSLNERYCATRRTIMKSVSPGNSAIEIESRKGVLSLLGTDSNLARRLLKTVASDQFVLDVHISVALCRPDDGYFLSYGTSRSHDTKAFAISRIHQSAVICTPRDSLHVVETLSGKEEVQALEALAGHLILRSLVAGLPRKGAVLIYEPPSDSLVAAIKSSRLWKHRQVYYATSRAHLSASASWIYLDGHGLASSMKQKIPRDVTSVINFSTSDSYDIRNLVPANCIIRRFEPSLLELESPDWSDAYSDALATLKHIQNIDSNVLPVHTLHEKSSAILTYPNIVDWRQRQDETVSVQVKALVVNGIFSSTKTHFMVGLSGELGQSICGYMAPWYNDARLSHLIVQPEENVGDSNEGAKDSMNIKGKLEQAKSIQEGHVLVQEAFSAKLEVLMQLDTGGVNAHIPLLDMGFDSLLAVETRTWFWQELHVDMPVLRFLEGDTVHEISEEIATQYLAGRGERDNEESSSGAVSKEGDTTTPAIPASSSGGDPSPSTPLTSECSDDRITLEVTGETSSNCSSSFDKVELPGQSVNTEGKVGKPGEETNSGITTQTHSKRDMTRVDSMSLAQSGLWFLSEYLDDPTSCNIVVSYTLKGRLDVMQLRKAIENVVAHHPSLRTCFYIDEETGEPTQSVLRASRPLIRFQTAHASNQEDIEAAFQALRDHQWDLAYGQMFGATLLCTEREDEYALVFGYHHIVIDGVSWSIILRDIQQAYTSKPLSRQKKMYIDAAAEQTQAIKFGALKKQIAYWMNVHNKLPDPLPLLPFTSAHRRKSRRRYHSHTITKAMNIRLVTKIKDASKSLKVTPFNFYLAALQVLFSVLLDTKDLCIGVTDASRHDVDLVNTVGYFVNILPLRFRLDSQDSFTNLVRQTSRHVLEARSNGQVPIDVILDHLRAPQDGSTNPLFHVVFSYRTGSVADIDLGNGCSLSANAYRDAEGPFDLGFGVYEVGDGSCGLQVIAQNYLYDEDAAGLIMETYYNLLETLVSDTTRNLDEYRIYNDPSIVKKGILAGKGPRRVWDWPDTLSKRVDTIIERQRDSVAIIEPHGTKTYGDLEDRIRLVAAAMHREGLPKGSRVAVLCLPSAELIISMLAILRLGHVYVPLDTLLPKERQAAILDDCRPAMVLCHQETLEAAGPLTIGIPIVNISNASVPHSMMNDKLDENLSESVGSAFVFYTSGSTGKPKGIVLNNFGFLNHIALKTYELSFQHEIVLQQSSFGFDMSLTQTFCALANGGSLVIVPKHSRGDPVAISRVMLEHSVTLTIATPSEYASLLRYGRPCLRSCQSWKNACMGGEVVTQQLVRSFQDLKPLNVELTNCYGPTETSLAVTFDRNLERSKESRHDHASVGRVLPNYSVYILDENSSQPSPLGHPGEICVGGAGVALGYLNLPDISASKFVDDPFADAEDIARGWVKMFKTGDRGRL